jgi:RNA polymerase sigma factor (sigma-70 family)
MTSAQAVSVLYRLRKLAASPAESASDAQLLARFTAGHDPGAFAGLVARHGPMVLGVCRSVLHNWHDAEDAFQATFLVLARKASSICKAESLASWLYGVAYRAAVRARAGDVRRRAREQRTTEMSSPDPLLDMTVREVRQVLHEELHQLPEKYRAPLVLCYLEGLSQDEAARQLGWSTGATRGRLDRGREQLRKRLARRGLALSAVLGAASLGASPVSAALAASAVQAAGGAASVSAKASALAEGVIHTMFVSKLKTATALLLVAALLTAGTGWLVHAAGEAKRSTAAPSGERAKKDARKGDKATATFAGRVLDPDGKPVAKARVYVTHYGDTKTAPEALAVTGEAGRFHFTVPKADPKGLPVAAVFALADGFGPAWAIRPGKSSDVTLRLVKDDVPIRGRILNLEGKPLAGVRIQVRSIKAPPGGSLTPWLDTVKKRATADGMTLEYQNLPMFHAGELSRLLPISATGSDGSFTLKGIGRERAVALLIEGPTIETREINVLTRSGAAPLTLPWYRDAPELGTLTYYPPRFDHAAAPCRPVSGLVRDQATGKPIAGAIVRCERGVGNPFYSIQATTDAAGRYRLTGLPVGQGQRGLDTLVAGPPEGQPYLSVQKRISGGGRLEPATVDFDLRRGLWIEGRVIDPSTGEGVEASLGYFAFLDDRAAVNVRSLYLRDWLKTDPQGRFRFVGAPVRALLGARVSGEKANHYCIGVGADKIEGSQRFFGLKGPRGLMFPTVPYSAVAWNHDVLAEIKPDKGAEKVKCDLVLEPGQRQKVRVKGPDGKPLAGSRVAGQFARESFAAPVEAAEITVYGLPPGESRIVMFQHEGKKLSGLLQLKKARPGLIEVKLQPAAAVSGRLVDTEGRPMRHAELKIYYQRDDEPNRLNDHWPSQMTTDAEGRFRVGNLVAGTRYLAHVRLKGKMYPGDVFRDLVPKVGESRDLGDVKPRTKDE